MLHIIWKKNIGNKSKIRKQPIYSILYWILNILCAIPAAFLGFIVGGNLGGGIVAEITDTYFPRRTTIFVNIGIIAGIALVTILISVFFSMSIKFIIEFFSRRGERNAQN